MVQRFTLLLVVLCVFHSNASNHFSSVFADLRQLNSALLNAESMDEIPAHSSQTGAQSRRQQQQHANESDNDNDNPFKTDNNKDNDKDSDSDSDSDSDNGNENESADAQTWLGERWKNMSPFLLDLPDEISHGAWESPPMGLKDVPTDQLQKLTPHLQAQLQLFPSCAVVGNSARLKDHQDGTNIDKHDAVFRCNNAPTDVFENHVGSKTTFDILSPDLADRNSRSSTKVVNINNVEDVQNAIQIFESTPESIFLMSPSFLGWVQESWLDRSEKLSSTGLRALLVALQLCKRVDAYGFGNGQGQCAHYYDCDESINQKFQAGSSNADHDWDKEEDVRNKLRLAGKINVH